MAKEVYRGGYLSDIEHLRKQRRQMIASILRNGWRYEGWTIQGFGMLRFYLSKEVRMHIWDDRFKTENVSVIHDHPWSFESEIISGEIRNIVYEEFRTPSHNIDNAKYLLKKYHMAEIQCGEGGGLRQTRPEPIILVPVTDSTYQADESYSQDATELHESIPGNGTITIITRKFHTERSSEHATVCYPYGTDWVTAEPRTATIEEVERVCEYALAKLKPLL